LDTTKWRRKRPGGAISGKDRRDSLDWRGQLQRGQLQWQYLPFDEQTKRGGYGTASEFLRTLIRDAQKRQAEDRLETMLLEGLDSGKPIEITPAYWQEKKTRIPKAPRRARHS
jgi:antitoxin ParD1/3/4